MNNLKQKLMKEYTLLPQKLFYPGMFDLPKGVFMLVVFVIHAAILAGYSVDKDYYLYGNLKGLLAAAGVLVASSSIQMLFLCCGYTWRKKNMRKAIHGQISGLLPSYYITGVALVAAVVLYSMLKSREVLGEVLYYGLPFLLSSSPAMTLFSVRIGVTGPLWCVVAYFFGGILLNLILQEKETWIQLTTVILLMCLGVRFRDVRLPFCIQQALICTGFMYLGWLIKKTKFLTKKIPLFFILLFSGCSLLLGAMGLCVVSDNVYKNGAVDVIAGTAVGLILFVVFLNANRWDGKILAFLRWMGKENFLFCSVHTFFILIPPIYGDSLLWKLFPQAAKWMIAILYYLYFLLTGCGGSFICLEIKRAFQKRAMQKGRT